MRYHLVINRNLDLDEITREAEAGNRPRHGFAMLAKRLGATLHRPDSKAAVRLADRLRSKIYGGPPEYWVMARALRDQLSPGDVIYCTGEDVGLPVASVCGRGRNRPKIAIFAHNLNRLRTKVILKLLGVGPRIDLYIAMVKGQVEFIRRFLSLPDPRVHLIHDQTDMKFFTPGPATPGKTRPMIASVGLEQRDYRTLAEATHDLDVDVRISGFSTDAAVQSQAFPETLPANMSQKFYEWTELVQLYRDADVVAISLFPCEYAAGITTMAEGLSCRRPIVVTRINGLSDYLDPEAVLIIEAGNAGALRSAIVGLLDDRKAAEALADRGHEIARTRYDSDRYIEEIAGLLEGLAGQTSAAAQAF